jgi:glycosyltransferase involved in cell wall biosynthesis
VSPERIHYIPNFIDPEIFHPARPGEKDRLKDRLGYSEKTLVLYAGRLVARKGIGYLLEAWRDVSPEFPDSRLLLLGDGPLRQSLEAASFRLGIAGTARFAGRVDNVPEYLRAADLFVLPSLQEGLPNALLEAMASGAPVVATRIGGVTDVVEPDRTAILVEPGDPGKLAKGLGEMLGNPSFRIGLADAALQRIGVSFGLDSRSRRYRELYRNICGGEAR